jgi:hypothetical protein
MPHRQAVIITRTAAQNECNCQEAAATLMNQGWSSLHNFNIRYTDRPLRVVEDSLIAAARPEL